MKITPKRTILFVGLSILAALVALVGVNLERKDKYSSLEAWKTHNGKRPGFRLLDAVDQGGYYICVYDTGRSEVAICWHRHTKDSTLGAQQSSHETHTIRVDDSGGVDLMTKQMPSVSLYRKQEFSVGFLLAYTHAENDGTVYPIRTNYNGPITVRLSSTKPVYEKTLLLNP